MVFARNVACNVIRLSNLPERIAYIHTHGVHYALREGIVCSASIVRLPLRYFRRNEKIDGAR